MTVKSGTTRATTAWRAGLTLAMIMTWSVLGAGAARAADGPADCGWFTDAVRLARSVAVADGDTARRLRDELAQLKITPDSVPPPGCAPSTAAGPGRQADGPTSTSASSGKARLPADVLDLKNWYLTLPTGKKGEPDTVRQPDLSSYDGPDLHLDDAKDGVVFTADAAGVTTENSSYPRSELRETDGDKLASWSNTSGTHTLAVRQAVMTLPVAKPEVVTAQIHDAHDDVVEVRLEGAHLIAQYDDGKSDITIDPDYKLGTAYDLEIVAAGGRIQISYNGARKADIQQSGSGWYFKSGSYLQSNTMKGDKADAVAAVVIYKIGVTHSR